MKLTSDQIEDLFVFVQKHYVEHYDLQMELVDHLANGIEQQWQEHPERLYKDARIREFRKFGVCGFYDVIKERKWAMEKRYWKLIFRFYKTYFKLPRVLLLIGAILVVFNILKLIPIGYKLYIIFGILGSSAGLMLLKSFKNRKKYKAKIGLQKRFMLEEMLFQFGNTLSFMIFPLHILNMFATKGHWLDNVYFEFSMAAFLVCFIVLCYVMVYIIPQKAEELLAETYPEYNFS